MIRVDQLQNRAGSVCDRFGVRPRADAWGSEDCVIYVSSIVGTLKTCDGLPASARADKLPVAPDSGTGSKPLIPAHPLGPMVVRVPSEHPAWARVNALGVFSVCVLVFSLAAWIVPDPAGYGTQPQLGHAPCMMPVLTGYPCPTCGMTTAFAYAVRGRLGTAIHAQPAGFLIAVLTGIAAVASVSVLASGKVWRVNWYRVPPARVAIMGLVIVFLGWAYKVATFASFHDIRGG